MSEMGNEQSFEQMPEASLKKLSEQEKSLKVPSSMSKKTRSFLI